MSQVAKFGNFFAKNDPGAKFGNFFAKKCTSLQILQRFLEKDAPSCQIVQFSSHVMPYVGLFFALCWPIFCSMFARFSSLKGPLWSLLKALPWDGLLLCKDGHRVAGACPASPHLCQTIKDPQDKQHSPNRQS